MKSTSGDTSVVESRLVEMLGFDYRVWTQSGFQRMLPFQLKYSNSAQSTCRVNSSSLQSLVQLSQSQLVHLRDAAFVNPERTADLFHGHFTRVIERHHFLIAR